MSIEYQIVVDGEHYIAGLKRYRGTKPLRHLFNFVKALGMLFFAAFTVFLLYHGKIFFSLVPVMFGLAIIFSHKLDHWMIKRNIQKSPHGNHTVTLSFSESGLHAKSLKTDTRLVWGAFTEYRRIKDGYLLFQGPKLYNWLPDEKINGENNISEIGALFEKNI